MENAVVQWQEELARQAKEVAALERPSIGNISFRGGVMKYQDQMVPGNKLEAIVVASVFENKWFENDFDPDKIEAPACFAFSSTGQEMTPHPNARMRQSEFCDSCPMLQWGSARRGKGKDCKEVRRLALLPMSVAKEGDVMGAELALMTVPVTSAKNWANYVNLIAAQYARPPWAMITEVSVHPHPKNQFEIKFNPLSLVGDDLLADLHQRNQMALGTLTTPYDYSAENEEPEPAAKSKGKKKY